MEAFLFWSTMSKQNLLEHLLKSTGASIDTRTIQPGQIFFALPGTKTDGARFAEEALEKGASMVVVLRNSEIPGDIPPEAKWQVDDVLATMQQLARDYRRHLSIPVLAITGSNGKTTNKNLLATALKTKFRVHLTPGNFNNNIGLPLTILNTPSNTDFILLEMGTNHFGEIKDLCRIAEPDYGSILNIGKAHLEFFHSVKGVLKAKSELADFLFENNSLLFLNEEEGSLQPLHAHPVKCITFDRNHLPGTDYRIEIERSVPDIVLGLRSTTGDGAFTLNSNLWGKHNIQNLLHTIAIGSYFGLRMKDMVEVLSQYIPQDNRSQILSWENHTVYLDAYNANPSSMIHAIRNFRAAHPTSAILVLGDMGEMGDLALKEHLSILKLVDQLGFENVYLVGQDFKRAGESDYVHFKYYDDVAQLQNEEWSGQAPILIKGSRFMSLDRLVDL